MFLATTGLTEFWDKDQELLYLGLWCLPREKISQWKGVRGRVMDSPWDQDDRSEFTRRCAEDIPERLVEYLGKSLNAALGINRQPRYWRILLRPWALAHVAVVADHWLHLDAAFRQYPHLQTVLLDPQDFTTPRDTKDHADKLLKDSYHLQLYSELLAGMNRTFITRRFPANAQPDPRARATVGFSGMVKEVMRGASRLLRSTEFADAYFSETGLDAKDVRALGKLSKGRVWPTGEKLPGALSFPPEPARRHNLAAFAGRDDLERLIARTLPNHLPTLFLEGFTRWREHVMSRWPRPPQRLIVSGRWQDDEYLKMLAAEGVERQGRIAVCQDGAACTEVPRGEGHDRTVADEYWTPGWEEKGAPGAPLKPMPHPGFLPKPSNPKAKPGDETALVCYSLPRYPYVWGFDHGPVWHRFYDYLRQRERFVAALPQWARDTLNIHVEQADMGWGHKERLARSFPMLRYETEPWTGRLERIKLLVLDNPESAAKALALNLPTVLFWDPELWRTRASLSSMLNAFKRCGILHDGPDAAAAKTALVLKDPLSWWRGAELQQTRADFCRLYARSDPDWANLWIKAAQEM
ncbi:MAG: hypothetical protein HY077_13435 [Elusimicrobia bacterium]|nr:hypothetical protein [Elusimicrobiota bacterium]